MKSSEAPRVDAAVSPNHWARVRSLVEEAIALPNEDRAAFLSASCGGDDGLRRRVERLAAACERAGGSWGFLERPAGELAAPMLIADGTLMTGPAARADGLPPAFHAALADRYAVGAELGRGGMATVYEAQDLRHQRRVALKVLEPHIGARLGAERFLAEIRVTANLKHPNLLPLFDSGEAGGLLYYVMPLIEGATLRARLKRERQLPVDEAVRIVRAIASALDYAHRQGVVHRDLKPENILLQDEHPLVADFGIALAVAGAGAGGRGGESHLTAPGISLGTPTYMSPEQTSGDGAVDGRSDIYSLACILYELLVGDPPFTGRSAQVVIAKVLGEQPSSVRMVRPSVPAHVEAALARALSKLPADRHATAREFGDALVRAPATLPTSAARWRQPTRFLLGTAATVGLASIAWIASAAWIASRRPAAPLARFVERNLIDQSLGSAITITPDGGALVYTGSAEGGRRLMLRPLDQRPEQAIAGTEGAARPYVAPDGRHLMFYSSDGIKTTSIDGGAAVGVKQGFPRSIFELFGRRQTAWRYGNGGWDGDSTFVSVDGTGGLMKREPGRGTRTVLTRRDTAQGEHRHAFPLLIPGTRAVVFTVSKRRGPGLVTGGLAIASLDPGTQSISPHRLLGVTARQAVAFVDGWLLYTSTDGTAIKAARLDVERGRIIGTEILVLEDEAGNLETASLADNGTLLYVRRPRTNSPALVDLGGGVHPLLGGSERSYMHPRISPDGKRFAVQVTSPAVDDTSAAGEDVWLYDIASRTPERLTTTGRAFHPTWTPDGRRIVFFVSASRELVTQPVDGGAAADTVFGTGGSFAPTVAPDGRSIVFQRGQNGGSKWSIWFTPLSGEGAPRMLLDEALNNQMPAVSPDGRWLAYTSGRAANREVYARPFPGPGSSVQISDGGGIEPAWSPDGHRIYYRHKDAFWEAAVSTPVLSITSRRQLFKGAFAGEPMAHRNYDVAPDGSGFLMIAEAGTPEAVVVLNWLPALRARLANAR